MSILDRSVSCTDCPRPLGFAFARQRIGHFARLEQAIGQRRLRLAQMLHEQLVQLEQTFATVEVCERHAEAQLERGCEGCAEGRGNGGHQRTACNISAWNKNMPVPGKRSK